MNLKYKESTDRFTPLDGENKEMMMQDIALKIEKTIQQDPGGRGLVYWASQGDITPAVESLNDGKHILIATGFYILSAGAIETDGPLGAIMLADALEKSGKKVTLIFDDHSEVIMKKGIESIGGQIYYAVVPANGSFDLASLITPDTTHFIALERPGRASDGDFYNFKGNNISKYHMVLDDFFTECGLKNITTIGIGDGGNELGMGSVSEAVDKFVGFHRPFSCQTAAMYIICSGVSNWAGYGIAALLSAMTGKNLMQPPEKLETMLGAIVAAGAVDGVSGKQEATVDGLEVTWEYGIYNDMFHLASTIHNTGMEN